MVDRLWSLMMIRLKCRISIDNSFSERTTLECLRVSAHAKQAMLWTLLLVSTLSKNVLHLKTREFSMMISGNLVISLLTLSITWKQDSSLMDDVSGLASLFSNQVLSELSATPRWLFLIRLNHTVTLLTLLRNLSLFAHLRTSHTKSSIPSNGQETTSKVSSLKDPTKLESLSKIPLDTFQQLTENSETSQQCSEVD